MNSIIRCRNFFLIGALLFAAALPLQHAFAQAGGADSTRALPVYVGPVLTQFVSDAITARGVLVAPEQLDVYSTFGGDVIALTVDDGSMVDKGQLLARVRRVDPGVTYEPERITAPMAGVVTRRNVAVGARVTPQTPLVQIARVDSLLFRADMLARDRANLEPGLRATLALANGTLLKDIPLYRVLPSAGQNGLTFPVDFRIANRGTLPIGLAGEASLTVATRNTLTVPRESVVEQRRISGVFAVRNGHAVWVPVTITKDLGERLAVNAPGLEEQEQVVTFGHEALTDGAAVTIHEDLRQ